MTEKLENKIQAAVEHIQSDSIWKMIESALSLSHEGYFEQIDGVSPIAIGLYKCVEEHYRNYQVNQKKIFL